MALFCSDCAEKMGFISDTPPFRCEGCEKEIPKQNTVLTRLWTIFRRPTK